MSVPRPSNLLRLLPLILTATTLAQSPAPPNPDKQIQDNITRLSDELTAAQQRLQESQAEILRLQQELLAIKAQLAKAGQPQPTTSEPVVAAIVPPPQDVAEQIQILQAEVQQHEQTKVESVSKYPVRFTGLVLFNTFVNKGSVDNEDFPSISSATPTGSSDLAFGASIRQTILGVQATGPRIFGAQSFAEVNLDFDGGIPYSNYGTDSGIVRLRTAALRLTWDHDTAELGFTAPLISPLSPSSYATVADPSLAWAGNLWTWSPQLSYEHRFASSGKGHTAVQFGLWDPPTAGYNTNQLFRTPSSGEHTGQPAYESRISYSGADPDNGLQLGVGGYYSRQSYPDRAGDSWATTIDWRLPITSRLQFSGEAYRGRAIGGLGGGVYKDVVTGNDPRTGLSTFRLLNAAGGWGQVKVHFKPLLESNISAGLDDGLARDFHSLILTSTSNTLLRARNRMVVANLIYSPKTYIILSPEFRRIWTWPITGAGTTTNVFTMSFGLRF